MNKIKNIIKIFLNIFLILGGLIIFIDYFNIYKINNILKPKETIVTYPVYGKNESQVKIIKTINELNVLDATVECIFDTAFVKIKKEKLKLWGIVIKENSQSVNSNFKQKIVFNIKIGIKNTTFIKKNNLYIVSGINNIEILSVTKTNSIVLSQKGYILPAEELYKIELACIKQAKDSAISSKYINKAKKNYKNITRKIIENIVNDKNNNIIYK